MTKTHPLEVLKFCPKCGSNSFVPADTRSLKCGDCGFHFFFNSAAAVAGLISDKKGRLMLVTRGIEPDYGMLDLPGGFVDPGETAEYAMVREMEEELGLKVKTMEFLFTEPNEYVFSDFTVFTLDIAFKINAETLTNLYAMDDILDYKFYSEEDLNYDNIPGKSIKKFVRKYFNNARNSK